MVVFIHFSKSNIWNFFIPLVMWVYMCLIIFSLNPFNISPFNVGWKHKNFNGYCSGVSLHELHMVIIPIIFCASGSSGSRICSTFEHCLRNRKGYPRSISIVRHSCFRHVTRHQGCPQHHGRCQQDRGQLLEKSFVHVRFLSFENKGFMVYVLHKLLHLSYISTTYVTV